MRVQPVPFHIPPAFLSRYAVREHASRWGQRAAVESSPAGLQPELTQRLLGGGVKATYVPERAVSHRARENPNNINARWWHYPSFLCAIVQHSTEQRAPAFELRKGFGFVLLGLRTVTSFAIKGLALRKMTILKCCRPLSPIHLPPTHSPHHHDSRANRHNIPCCTPLCRRGHPSWFRGAVKREGGDTGALGWRAGGALCGLPCDRWCVVGCQHPGGNAQPMPHQSEACLRGWAPPGNAVHSL